MAEPATRFVVKRLNWWDEYGGKLVRRPGEVAVASFATFDEADAERAKREDGYRKRLNPFECGLAIYHLTHLDEPRLRDWLMDHGIDPPESKTDGTTNWAAWWKKYQKKLGAEKRAAVWEVLDKVRFFAVREEPVRPVGYAVVEVHWNYNDEYYDADADGGKLVKVYRSRERAEAECSRRCEEARANWDQYGTDDPGGEFDPDTQYVAFDLQDRLCRRRGILRSELDRGEGLYATAARVPFFEVIEVSLEGLE
jgi:hypothetical protein